MRHPNQLLSRTKSNYYKFKSRLEKSISNGTFDGLNRRRKNTLVSRVEKFRSRLESMSLSMKGAAVAGTVAAGAILPNTADAQTQGVYFRKTGGAIPFPASTNDFVMANIDADPELEIILSTNTGGAILNGNIDDGFTSASPATLTNMERDILVGDLDGDTDLDLIFTSTGVGTNVYKAINDGDGNFVVNTLPQGASNSNVDLVDWDSDGDLDVVMSTSGYHFDVSVNDGDGNFVDFGSINLMQASTFETIRDLEFADVDNDGDMDLIHTFYLGTVPYTSSINIQENTTVGPGVPTFDPLNPIKIRERDYMGRFDGIKTFDMDGDGDLDIFWNQAYFSTGFASQNQYIEGTPLGFLDISVSSAPVSSGAVNDAAVADFDNDGDDDLILVRAGGNYNELLRFNGTTLSSTAGDLNGDVGDVAQNFSNISLGDLDGDGHLDLVGESGGTDYAYLDVSGPQNIAIAPNDFTERRAVANGEIGALIAFDRDGNDIADTDGGTVFSLGAGDGTNDADNSKFTISGSGSTARLMVSGSDLDFETQSTYRILLAGTASGVTREFEFELHLQNSPETGNGTFAATSESVYSARTESPVMADIDGDGDDELIYKRSSGNSNIYLQTDLTESSGTQIAYGDNVILSDFDNDGDQDLITNNSTDVFMHLNNGTGDFSDSYTFQMGSLGATVRYIAVADFNNDGYSDIVLVSSDGGAVWSNDGDRTFTLEETLTSSSSHDVEVGDFDEDGRTDLIFRSSNNSFVMSNDGGGAFSQIGVYNFSSQRELIVADFDGDGDLDVLIATDNDLYLLDGQGDGTFAQYGTSVPYLTSNGDIIAGDFDGDGLIDVAFVTDEGSGGENVVTYLNDGSNSFDFAQVFPVAEEDEYASFRGLAFGDMDGDDDLDMIVSGGEYRQVLENTNIAPYLTGFSGRSIIDENTPIGTVLGQVTADDPNGDAVTSISFADGANNNDLFLMDASGNITLNSELDWETLGSDLIVQLEVDDDQGNTRIEDGQLKVNNLAEKGHGIFNSDPIKIFGSRSASVFEPGDYDQDGDADLFRSSGSYYGNDIFQQNDGSFLPEFLPIKYALNEATFIDYDNDGDLDLLNVRSGSLRIAKNDDGYFSDNDFIANYDDIDQLIAGDFDGDGLMEVAIRFEQSDDYDYYGVQILEVDEDGEFGQMQEMLMYDGSNPPASLVDGDFENMSIGNFNGDEFDDLLITTANGDDVIFAGSASGFSFSYTTAITSNDYGFSYGTAGDVNGDGLADIISVRGSDSGLEKIIDIHVNDGNASFTLNQSISGTQLTAIMLGDIDGDGSLDMITGSYEDDGDGQDNYDIDIRTNDGSGTFTQVQTISDVDADDLKLMDVDGDDDLDIVARRAYREEEDDHVLFVFRNSNVAPTAINLSSSSLDEHLPLDTEIATITIDDLNANDTHVISLVTGDGSNDLHNSFFSLNNNSLRVTKDVRFEDTPQLFIYLSVYDGHQTYEQAIVFNVNNVNQAPTAINLSATAFDEGTTPGSTVATISAVDPNVGDSHTFSLVTGNGTNDADNGLFLIDGDKLIITSTSSFEAKGTYNIYLSASDIDNAVEQAFVLAVNDVNQGPTAIALSNTSLDEGTSPGAVIASITVTDPNAGDTHELSLASGNGSNDAHNDLFVISNSNLILIGDVNFDTTPTLKILVSAEDAEDSFEQAFVLTVNDVLGVRDEVSNTLGIYPNPGSNQLAINLDNGLRGTMSIRISDLSGKVFHAYESEKNGDQWIDKLDMTNASPGIYLVEILLDNQQFTQRWIKSK